MKVTGVNRHGVIRQVSISLATPANLKREVVLRRRRRNFLILTVGGIYLSALILPNLWHLMTILL